MHRGLQVYAQRCGILRHASKAVYKKHCLVLKLGPSTHQLTKLNIAPGARQELSLGDSSGWPQKSGASAEPTRGERAGKLEVKSRFSSRLLLLASWVHLIEDDGRSQHSGMVVIITMIMKLIYFVPWPDATARISLPTFCPSSSAALK